MAKLIKQSRKFWGVFFYLVLFCFVCHPFVAAPTISKWVGCEWAKEAGDVDDQFWYVYIWITFNIVAMHFESWNVFMWDR
jgi:hypothetical protein